MNDAKTKNENKWVKRRAERTETYNAERTETENVETKSGEEESESETSGALQFLG